MRTLMMILLVAGLLTPVLHAEESVPWLESLKDLQPAWDNPKKFVPALRDYEMKEREKIAYEQTRAGELKMEQKIEEYTRYLEAAKKRYDLLRQAYETALKRYPDEARLHNYYGELLWDFFNETDKAMAEWDATTRLDPAFPNPYNNRGMHYCHFGEYDKGLAEMEKAIELDPKHPDFLFNMAQMCLTYPQEIEKRYSLKKPEVYAKAMDLSKRAAEYAPDDYSVVSDYAVNFFAADNFAATPDWKEAAAAWKQARKSASTPNQQFYTWLNEARSWIKAEKNAEAQRCLKKALELRPQSDIVKQLLEGTKNEPRKPNQPKSSR